MRIKLLYKKILEALISVLPITLIIIILHFTPLVSLTNKELIIFLFSAVLLILGIGLFNLGADIAMTPMGEHIGQGLSKSGKLNTLLLVSFLLGFFVTIAEPDLSALATQLSEVLSNAFNTNITISKYILILVVGFGVGLFLLLAIIKIIKKQNLNGILFFFYLIVFSVTALVISNGNENFLALGFDSGGVTTGPITVPMIMALGVGVALTIGGRNAKENSFGLIALCSVGPILAVLFLGLFIDGNSLNYVIPSSYVVDNDFFSSLLVTFLSVVKDVTIALSLMVAFFFVINAVFIKLPKDRIQRIVIGIIYTYFGLIIFLTSVNVGFMPIGYKLGQNIASNKVLLSIFGFILGLVVVLAEPAVHVLNKQVSEITDGLVTKKSMMIALSTGVGISILLSMIRIIFNFSILYYLIPGYIISLGLSFFVPKIYTAIAFDSGGVASGPLTSSFILPFAVGACMSIQGSDLIMKDAFGIVAMVAMTPLITIQLLGFKAIATKKVKEKIAMKKILDKDDDQIIEFM